MSTLTITNSIYIPLVTFTETARLEDDQGCIDSYVEFTVTGNVTDYPIKLEYNGSPSGAQVTIDKIGAGTGIFKDSLTNTEYFGDTQPKDGAFNLFSERDLLLTNTGTTNFRLRLNSTDTARNMATNKLVILSCSNNDGLDSVTVFSGASLTPQDNGTEAISVANEKTMYYSNGLA